MDNSNAVLLLKALDGLSARSAITAENIANASTPGYRPLRLTFEKALAAAAAQGDDAVSKLEPAIERAQPGVPDAELRVDLELATASQTALRYAALVEMLSRQSQIDSLAITGTL
jgi:flagellar basal-body rod protein FlgB